MPKVRVPPNEGPLAAGFEGELHENELPLALSTIYVDELRPHEHDIVTQMNGSGIISVRYVDEDKVTASGLIPRHLRNPN